ncbi:hypothetical protein J7413_08915 [Shimia sp. R10_1]|uniref:hypothetical protein n=1 Tax=Shimia sp. R10_1 TaxID=2821095 RepID=UPI001ADA6165|nr:hypothetical protein [Shimia sp. R10_1]MBO9473655.1 hypothetical protein [Shimia sp. R10_1]
MEQALLRIYRRYVPRWIKRNLSEETKDWLLGTIFYVNSKTDTGMLDTRRKAMFAMRRRDWREAIFQWQLIASFDLTRSGSPVSLHSKNDKNSRRVLFAKKQIRVARVKFAKELLQERRFREFREQCARVMEMIPDQRILKKDRELLNLVKDYAHTSIEVGGDFSTLATRSSNPKRIAICLDVLKVSDVHTHSRVIFAMGRNLLSVDKNIEVHVFITNERFVVTTPVVAESFHPQKRTTIEKLAQNILEDLYNTRFFIHYMISRDLEGLVSTCNKILEIKPDVILYGGGHRGLFSNESRLIRHCLYDFFPTVFFFIQSNNQVDKEIDMIIARGPHKITGDFGKSVVRVQPYPTILGNDSSVDKHLDRSVSESQTIVSAISGVRLNVKMAEMSDANLKRMFGILDRVPGTVWYFVGAADPDELVRSNRLIEKRVRAGQIRVLPVLPFIEFSELVCNSSLFLHLPGFTGGSGGASVARRSGIPILTFSHSDVSGRQPQQTIFDERDVSGWAEMAIRLLTDQDFWNQTVTLQRAHTNWIKQTSSRNFYNCLVEACELGRNRINCTKTKMVEFSSKL